MGGSICDRAPELLGFSWCVTRGIELGWKEGLVSLTELNLCTVHTVAIARTYWKKKFVEEYIYKFVVVVLNL